MPIKVVCNYCGKTVVKSNGRYNEEKKFGWKSYCSLKCLGKSRRSGKRFTCSRNGCNKTFIRLPKDSVKSKFFYCSISCSAIVNNGKRVLKPRKKCKICDSYLKYGLIYCSPKCQQIGATQTQDELLNWIKEFYKSNLRIPLKRECSHYHAVRLRFGSWNNAIISAGYIPNPVMFAKKYIANDGHKCDSLAERIIDDYLTRRNINHKRSVAYPNNEKYTADFVVGKNWIEFFGLSGELRSYDFLKRKKIKIAKKLGINLIKIYPKDLFPKGKLDKVLYQII